MPTAMVFAPAPLLTVTIESGGDGPEVHLHAGGQGFWIARMLRVLGVEPTLCGSFGGESGPVICALAADAGIDARGVRATTSNGVYVHDRRSGKRVVVADVPPEPLDRHAIDDLYGMALSIGFDADVCVLGGPSTSSVVPASVYRRLAADLRSNDRVVLADLSGDPLDAALAGGVTVAKVSHEDLQRDGRVDTDARRGLVAELAKLANSGAEHVVLTRGDESALVSLNGAVHEIDAPLLQPVDERGAGDSLTAGVAAGLARGMEIDDALRLGAAAGCMNVTRHGLASGSRDEIERMARHVTIRPTTDGEERACERS